MKDGPSEANSKYGARLSIENTIENYRTERCSGCPDQPECGFRAVYSKRFYPEEMV